MKNTITVTTKGTFTMPAEIRKKLGINQKGDKVKYLYDKKNKRLIIEKSNADFKKLQQTMQKNLKPGIKPLQNIDDYYQEKRKIT